MVVAAGLVLIPSFDADGAAVAAVLADVTLCAASYAALRRAGPGRALPLANLARIAVAALPAIAIGAAAALPPIASAVAAVLVFVGGAVVLKAVPSELLHALPRRRRPSAMNLSAVLAVRNEEHMLERGLKLLGFCDEIVVVIDARTTDRTEEIARRHTDRVWVEEFEDFSQHKNAAIEKARGDVAADRRRRRADHPGAGPRDPGDARARPRRVGLLASTRINFFLGGRMDHGALERRPPAADPPRARASTAGRSTSPSTCRRSASGKLREGMWHFSHRSIEDMLAKTIRFGEVQARELHEAGAPQVTAAASSRA